MPSGVGVQLPPLPPERKVMRCQKCENKTGALIKVKLDIFDADDPQSAMHETKEWCVNCIIERAIKSKFKGGPR